MSAEEEILDDEPKSILLGMISQLRLGMDLHRVTFPTFVLEPRSMLERITDFMSHPELIVHVHQEEDPEKRFIDVLRYYLAGWHIKPRGVKKPYNPVLGEIFRCRYEFDDKTSAYYVAEQVSHHPPVSAYYFASPENNYNIRGDLRPKSKFLGNSACSIMLGEAHIVFTNKPEEVYTVTMPNMYARGILFGKMLLELGDTAKVSCPKTGYSCEIEFKTKGFFSGSYNCISGKIKDKSGKDLYEISGRWSDKMSIKNLKTSKTEVLFDADNAKIFPKQVAPEEEQEALESRRLWTKVTKAIIDKNLDGATDGKTEIEDAQRADAKVREDKGVEFEPRYFKLDGDEYWPTIGALPSDPKEAVAQLKAFLWQESAPQGNHTSNVAAVGEKVLDEEPATTTSTKAEGESTPAATTAPAPAAAPGLARSATEEAASQLAAVSLGASNE